MLIITFRLLWELITLYLLTNQPEEKFLNTDNEGAVVSTVKPKEVQMGQQQKAKRFGELAKWNLKP